MDRKEIKEKELEFLAGEYKKNPQFLVRETRIDDPSFLGKIGISFPEKIKKNLFLGYLRLWPQDFIVEEILKEGTIETVDFGNFLKEEKELSNEPTIYGTLVKCGLSTIEAAEEMSSFLGIDKKEIRFSGIKDKDALTAQLVSFRKTNIDNLKKISSPYFFLKNVYPGKGVMETGGLKGNKFTILIRTDDSFEKEKFLVNLEIIRKQGFYNFYYSQRFGSPRFINWFWGLLILKGEYEKAISSFLCSFGQRETLYFKNLREKIKENLGNWEKIEKIIEPLPIIFQNESKVIRYLKENPKDFIGALNQIPEQVNLWIYAYVSFLFNRKLSSYLIEKQPLPEFFNLILSKDENDWKSYREFLEEDGISSLSFKNLKPFSSYIQLMKRQVKTKEMAEIHKVEFIPEGVVLSFTLPRACYATTFLSHFFQLSSGLPPQNISDKAIDVKEVIKEGSLQKVLERFKDVIYPKTKDIFEKFE